MIKSHFLNVKAFRKVAFVNKDSFVKEYACINKLTQNGNPIN